MIAPDGRALRATNWLMAVVFVVCAAVQVNDPDPLGWVLVYGAAAAACVARDRVPWDRILAAVTGAAALVWLLFRGRAIVPAIEASHLMLAMERKTPAIEESREFLGFVIVVVWMAVLLIARRSRPARG